MLDPAIKQINVQEDFKLTLESLKEGRSTSYFMLKIKVLRRWCGI
ncbi:replication initiation protein [Moraxella canis]